MTSEVGLGWGGVANHRGVADMRGLSAWLPCVFRLRWPGDHRVVVSREGQDFVARSASPETGKLDFRIRGAPGGAFGVQVQGTAGGFAADMDHGTSPARAVRVILQGRTLFRRHVDPLRSVWR